MEFKPSDRLKLRVEALRARLGEVSAELSALKGSAFQARERLHELSFEALMEGRHASEEASGLEEALARHEAAMPAFEEQEMRLRKLLFDAKRDHLRQLRKERPGQWIVLD